MTKIVTPSKTVGAISVTYPSGDNQTHHLEQFYNSALPGNQARNRHHIDGLRSAMTAAVGDRDYSSFIIDISRKAAA